MNERHVFKHSFGWMFILILLISIIFLSARLLRTRKTEQEKQVTQLPFEKENIVSEIQEPRAMIKETPESKTEDITEPKPKVKDSPEIQQKLFTIQVASFQDKARAETAVKELKKKNYIPVISSKDLGEKGIWYRVYVDDFDSEDDASELLNTLKKDYKDSFIKLR